MAGATSGYESKMWHHDRPVIRRDSYIIEVSSTVRLEGELWRPRSPVGLIVFVHGSGTSRASARDRYVAELLHRAGLGTLLIDLLTVEEVNGLRERFAVEAFGDRVTPMIDRLVDDPRIDEPIGLFAVGTGAAAAICAAAARPDLVGAIVCRSGRPDLAGDALGSLIRPLLMIVGADDEPVLGFNRASLPTLPEGSALEIVPGASHLFDQPGALDAAAERATAWFVHHLDGGSLSTDGQGAERLTDRSPISW